jgi:hypothetical protein
MLPDPGTITESLSQAWSYTCSVFLDTSHNVLGTVRRSHRDWFDEKSMNIHEFLCKKIQVHFVAGLLRRNTATNRERFSSLRSATQRELRTMQNEWWVVRSVEMQASAERGDLQSFYYEPSVDQ